MVLFVKFGFWLVAQIYKWLKVLRLWIVENYLEEKFPIENLPNEILSEVFSFLPQEDLLNSSLVSKRFNAVSKLPSTWRKQHIWISITNYRMMHSFADYFGQVRSMKSLYLGVLMCPHHSKSDKEALLFGREIKKKLIETIGNLNYVKELWLQDECKINNFAYVLPGTLKSLRVDYWENFLEFQRVPSNLKKIDYEGCVMKCKCELAKSSKGFEPVENVDEQPSNQDNQVEDLEDEMDSDFFNDSQIELAMPSILQQCSHLTRLNFSKKNYTADDVHTICRLKNLEELILSNWFNSDMGPIFAKCDMKYNLPALKSLVIWGNIIDCAPIAFQTIKLLMPNLSCFKLYSGDVMDFDRLYNFVVNFSSIREFTAYTHPIGLNVPNWQNETTLFKKRILNLHKTRQFLNVRIQLAKQKTLIFGLAVTIKPLKKRNQKKLK